MTLIKGKGTRFASQRFQSLCCEHGIMRISLPFLPSIQKISEKTRWYIQESITKVIKDEATAHIIGEFPPTSSSKSLRCYQSPATVVVECKLCPFHISMVPKSHDGSKRHALQVPIRIATKINIYLTKYRPGHGWWITKRFSRKNREVKFDVTVGKDT